MTVVSNWNKAKNELVEAAKVAGIDPEIMVRIAHLESRFGSDARPISSNASKNTIRQFDGKMAISSAHGYGQFVDETWKGVLIKYGDKYGIENTASLSDSQVKLLRTDTKLQAAMLAEFTRDNIAKGEKLGGANKDANVYAFHNLGGRGAEKLLIALKENPNQKVSNVLSSKTISNNPGLYKDGTITVQQVYNNMALEMGRADVYAKNINSQEVLQESSISKSSVAAIETRLAKLKAEKTDLTADINVVKGQKKTILELGEHLKSHSFDNLKDVQKLDALAKTAGIELVTPAEAILADKKTINYTNKADVTALQNVLFERGLITSPSRGIFGTQTKNALIKEFDLPQNHTFGNELAAEYLEKLNPKTVEAIQEKVDLALSKVQKNLTTLENKMIVIDQSITALEAKRVALNDPTIENSLETQQALRVADVESPDLAQLQDDLVLKEMFIAELEQRIANLTALTAQVPDQSLEKIEKIEKPDIKIDLLEVENKNILLTMTESGMSFNINGKDHDASYFNQHQVGITDTQSTYRNENNTLLAKYEYESDQFSIFHKNPYTADKIAVISNFSEQNTINLVSFDAVKTQSLEKQKSLGKEC